LYKGFLPSISILQCYDFDKFEGYPIEEEAVARGITLLNQNQLWAVIIFDSADANVTSEDELPFHISYKIRFDPLKETLIEI
jgi:ATP-binding cassette subfamily A (ABC1) protein 1